MTDNKNVVTCPACDKVMTKVFIENAGVNVDVCLDGCGGILFDNRELEMFDEKHENADEILEIIKNKTFEHVHKEEVRICSLCDSPMVKQGSGASGIEIDVCNNCGAKFLDHKELEKIRKSSNKNEAFRNEQLAKIEEYLLENPVEIGGKLAKFADKHYVPSVGRQDMENFIRKLLFR